MASPNLTAQPLDSAPAGSSGSAARSAPKCEIESFQVVARGSGGGLTGVDVVPGALTGPGGVAIPASDVNLYAEKYTRVWTPSELESLDQNGTAPSGPAGSQFSWSALLPAGAHGTCGVPTTYSDRYGTPFNGTWR